MTKCTKQSDQFFFCDRYDLLEQPNLWVVVNFHGPDQQALTPMNENV